MRSRRGALLGLAPILAATLAGCRVHGLAFVVDDRIDIAEPADRSTVQLPLTVRWIAGVVDGPFELVVDRSPQPPGEPVSWFGDAATGVYVTESTSATIDMIATQRVDARRGDLHRLTLVLVDDAGRRRGEAAWSVEVRVEDER